MVQPTLAAGFLEAFDLRSADVLAAAYLDCLFEVHTEIIDLMAEAEGRNCIKQSYGSAEPVGSCPSSITLQPTEAVLGVHRGSRRHRLEGGRRSTIESWSLPGRLPSSWPR